MTEFAGSLEGEKDSKIKRFLGWVGGGLSVAQSTEVGFVEADQPANNNLEIAGFDVSEPIQTSEQLTEYLKVEEATDN